MDSIKPYFGSPAQNESHFYPVSLWQAAKIFPIYYADRFEERMSDGRISVAAFQRSQAQSTVFWAEQLLLSLNEDDHEYVNGFIYTSLTSDLSNEGPAAVWYVHPFKMALCLHKHPPMSSDFDYTDDVFLLRCLYKALPADKFEFRPLYDLHFVGADQDAPFEGG